MNSIKNYQKLAKVSYYLLARLVVQKLKDKYILCSLNESNTKGKAGFLKLFLYGHLYMCVCVFVCVSTPEDINNQGVM